MKAWKRIRDFWNAALDREMSIEEAEGAHRAGVVTQWFGLGFAPALFTFLEWVIVFALIDYARVRTEGFDHALVVLFEFGIVIGIWFYFGSVFQDLPPAARTARELLKQTRLLKRASIGIAFALLALFFGYRLASVVGNVQSLGQSGCPADSQASTK